MDTIPFCEEVGRRLRASRALAGYSQLRAAQAIGAHQFTLSRYERGQMCTVDPGVLARLCVLYGVSADYILGLKAS